MRISAISQLQLLGADGADGAKTEVRFCDLSVEPSAYRETNVRDIPTAVALR